MKKNKSGHKPGSAISIVVPTLNEVDNVGPLFDRLQAALRGRTFEVIFVDDRSTDGTVDKLQELASADNVRYFTKNGTPGKAYSLIEGFEVARFPYVAMIDADLQYPPEAIPEMLEIILDGQADVVVADRQPVNESTTRKITSKGFRTVFGRLLWGLDVDVQSGLKVFKKELIDCLPLNPHYAWAFDLEFLLRAHNGGYKLESYTISFEERTSGTTKIQLLPVIKQLAVSALKLKVRPPYHIPFHATAQKKDGHGFHYRGQKYVTHTTLGIDDMAVTRMSLGQRVALTGLLLFLLLAFLVDWRTSLITLISVITFLYFMDLLFNLYLITQSFYQDKELKITDYTLATWSYWPRYTIFCPLYKEADVLPQFVEAMQEIDYPEEKLEIMLLLEADDTETIQAARDMNLPASFQIVVVPHGMPKTKPKACNYGLIQATGEYAVIYDAEDIPDPQQLKKAVIAFSLSDDKIGCIQAKLNYYNSDQNILTRLFTLEYSLWFNLVLTGLQSIRALIPLGGTSNHFRVRDLREFEGWDPFNVTEDADLGIRLAKRGMRTAILDSFTLEEANSEYRNWIKQRSRWIKGYMQTYLVHMRSPRKLTQHRKIHLLTLQMVVGGKIFSMLVNPLLWLTTLTYLLVPAAREFVESLYLTPIMYLGVISLVVGNFLYMYYYMLGAMKQGRPELIIYALLIPFYWLMMSVAAIYAFRELIVRPHHWHKTKHGLHLKKPTMAVEALPEAA